MPGPGDCWEPVMVECWSCRGAGGWYPDAPGDRRVCGVCDGLGLVDGFRMVRPPGVQAVQEARETEEG